MKLNQSCWCGQYYPKTIFITQEQLDALYANGGEE